MKLMKCYIIVFLSSIILSSCINGPDPFLPLHEYHVLNMSQDSIVCRYHCIDKSIKDANTIVLHSGEKKILYFNNINDTLSETGIPHCLFEDMLFTHPNGDTILYINPIVDSTWCVYDTTFYHNVYGGKKWIYKFNNK